MLESTLDEIVKRVVEVADPERVILFGSRAREEERFDSDYDLLVIKSGVKHRRALAQEIYRNLAGVGASVDVLVETPEHLESCKYAPGLVYAEALNGRTVYERH